MIRYRGRLYRQADNMPRPQRVASAQIPNFETMSKEEWRNYSPPQPDSGHRMLYHGTVSWSAEAIARDGILQRHSKSPPAGSIWATTDRSYGTQGTIIVFQVPENDPYVEYVAGGHHAIIMRDVSPEDILEIDPYLGAYDIFLHASEARQGEYADIYYDELISSYANTQR